MVERWFRRIRSLSRRPARGNARPRAVPGQLDVQEARCADWPCSCRRRQRHRLCPQLRISPLAARRYRIRPTASSKRAQCSPANSMCALTSAPRVGGRGCRRNIHLEARNGTVKRDDLLRNILTLNSIARLLRPGTPRVGEVEMPYRRLTVDGRFHAQHFILEQLAFDSTFTGVGATGTIGFVHPDTRVLVLVAPFSRTDQLVRAIPAIGYVVDGTFTTVPVSLTGDYRDPRIVPLGPEAITLQLTGIFERTLKLPRKLL